MVSNGEGWIKEEHNWEHNRNDIVFDHYTIKLGFCWKGIGKQKNWKSLGSISEFYKRENENNGKGQDIKQEKKSIWNMTVVKKRYQQQECGERYPFKKGKSKQQCQ